MPAPENLQPVPAQATEVIFALPHLRLSALTWGTPEGKPLLALHGWLDNAMTFIELAPHLAAAGFYVVAPDLAGHGYSAWRPTSQNYLMLDNCFDIQALAEHLGWQKFTLVGHSMGAGVASMFAGAQPQQVEKLVVIDGLGTLTTPDAQAADQLGKALNRWLGHQARKIALEDKDAVSAFSGKIYPSIEAAATARMQGVGAVDFNAALALCQRALRWQEHKGAEGWAWRSDSRLRHPSAIRLNEAQNQSFMRAIQAPTLYVEGKQGLTINRPEIAQRLELIQNLEQVRLEGGHHLHLEQTSCVEVATAIVHFLT